jgi:hypothetical protein
LSLLLVLVIAFLFLVFTFVLIIQHTQCHLQVMLGIRVSRIGPEGVFICLDAFGVFF